MLRIVCPTLFLFVLLISTSTIAQSILFSAGVEGVDGEDKSVELVSFEYIGPAFLTRGRLSSGFSVALRVDGDRDIFVGGGVASEITLSPRWFFETSLLAGFYNRGRDGTELGGNFQFRSLFGIGFMPATNWAVSFAFDHVSNSSIDRVNPGTEVLAIRIMLRL